MSSSETWPPAPEQPEPETAPVDERPSRRRRVDVLPVFASVLAVAVTGLYLVLVSQEDGEAAWWAVAVLVGAAAGAAYAAPLRARWRRTVLVVCAVPLFLLGFVAILSIGMPILLASALCAAAALRARPEKDWRDQV